MGSLWKREDTGSHSDEDPSHRGEAMGRQRSPGDLNQDGNPAQLGELSWRKHDTQPRNPDAPQREQVGNRPEGFCCRKKKRNSEMLIKAGARL